MNERKEKEEYPFDFVRLVFRPDECGEELIPAIIRDDRDGRVLMLGYMNREALRQTVAEGEVTFYSRSRGRLWTKGETSGNRLAVRDLLADCDGDALLIGAVPSGPVCHTGSDTCFGDPSPRGFLYRLEETIKERKEDPPEGSYTASLFAGGVDAIAQKVGEEAVELVIAAKGESDDRFLNEAADLLYHLLALLTDRGYSLEDVENVLAGRSRNNASG